MDFTSMRRCSCPVFAHQGRGFVCRSLSSKSTRWQRPVLGSRRQVIGRAADLEKKMATDEEIEAMENGAVAIPKDPAGNSITGGRPAPGGQRGSPTGSHESPNMVNPAAILQLDEIKIGEWYEGQCRNIESYGVFFDIGAGKAGLCHVSQLAAEFVKDTSQFINVGEKRQCRILDVDLKGRKISLSLLEPGVKNPTPRNGRPPNTGERSNDKQPGARASATGGAPLQGPGKRQQDGGNGRRPVGGGQQASPRRPQAKALPNVKVGTQVTAKVTKIEAYGMFMSLGEGTRDGLLHASEMGIEREDTVAAAGYNIGDDVKVWVRDVDKKKNNISLSINEPEAAGPKTTVATSSSGPARKKNSSMPSGMSSLGSMLAMAGFKTKAQLEKEEKQLEKEEKKTSLASSNGAQLDMSADDKSNSNEPQILEKSDETPASADDVELDSAAIPQASLEKEDDPTAPLEGGSAGTEAGPEVEEKGEDHPTEAPAAPVESSEPGPQELPPAMEGEPTPAEEKSKADASKQDGPSASLQQSAIESSLASQVEAPSAEQDDPITPLEGGSAGTEAGPEVAEKGEDHPTEAPAAPVESSEPAPQELPPAMEGEPTPAEEKSDSSKKQEAKAVEPLEGAQATSDAGPPAQKTEEHPRESPAAPVEASSPPEVGPEMEGEPSPAEEKLGPEATAGAGGSGGVSNPASESSVQPEQSAIAIGQQANNDTTRPDQNSESTPATGPTSDQPTARATQINIEDSADNLEPKYAENPIQASMSAPQQEASLASADLDGGLVTPTDLPGAKVPEPASAPANSAEPAQASLPAQEKEPTSSIEAAVEEAKKTAQEIPSEKAADAEAGPAVSAKTVKDLREKTGAGMMDCKKALRENNGDVQAAMDYLRKKGLAGADKKAGRIATEGLVASYIHAGSGLGVLIEVNCETDFVARGDIFKGLCSDLAMQIAAFGDVVAVSGDNIDPALIEKEREIEMGKEDILSKPENKRAMIVEGRISKTKKRMSLMDQPYIKNNEKDVQTFVKETIAQLGENIQVRRFERFVLGEGIEKKSADLAKEVEEQTNKMKEAAAQKALEAPKEEEAPEPTAEQVANLKVSAKEVSQLRKSSGAGMMDCKRALAACDGDLEKASDYLRKKGLASADKKAGRIASEGVVASYIHGGRLGVLVEVNCETDFVARGDVFQTLAADMAMQLASNSQVEAVAKEDFPQENLAKEREIAMQMEDIQSKPENIRAKIVDGRLGKFAAERSLLEQPYIKDPKKTVGQHVKEIISQLGENITVRRFVRFNLGEGLAKKEENFAEEIAKATGGQ